MAFFSGVARACRGKWYPTILNISLIWKEIYFTIQKIPHHGTIYKGIQLVIETCRPGIDFYEVWAPVVV